MRDLQERVLDVLEAIERIEKYARGGRDEFDGNELIQVWILHHLQIVGEAANALRPELQETHPEVPWAAIVGMRNILVHQYFDLDAGLVWAAVENDVPKLKVHFEALLKTAGRAS